MLSGFGCNDFFAVLESSKLHKRFKKLAEKFLAMYRADEVEDLDINPEPRMPC